MTPILCALGLFLSQIFERFDIPLASDAPQALEVESGYDSTRDMLVLDGHALTVYENFRQGNAVRIALPQSTSAVDYADISGDGRRNVIAIAGSKVLAFDLSGLTDPAPVPLFEAGSILEAHTGPPFPMVLVVSRENQPVIAIPAQDMLRIYSVSGEVLQEFPIGANAPYHAMIGEPFQGTPLLQNRAAPANALEITVQQTRAVKPDLPQDWLPTALPLPRQRPGTQTQLLDAAKLPPEHWPWFPLAPAQDTSDRVLYAVDAEDDPVTLVCYQRIPANDTGGPRYSPVRRYPGNIVQPTDAPPDFDNDGFADLLTWIAPVPVPSIGNLTRAAGGGAWPLSLQAHLYEPDNGGHAPRAAAAIKLEITLETLLREGPRLPLHHFVLDDMNGDGKSDIGFSKESETYYLWLKDERGFVPAHENPIPIGEPVREIALHGRINAQGDYALVLRTEKKLIVLGHRNDDVGPPSR